MALRAGRAKRWRYISTDPALRSEQFNGEDAQEMELAFQELAFQELAFDSMKKGTIFIHCETCMNHLFQWLKTGLANFGSSQACHLFL